MSKIPLKVPLILVGGALVFFLVFHAPNSSSLLKENQRGNSTGFDTGGQEKKDAGSLVLDRALNGEKSYPFPSQSERITKRESFANKKFEDEWTIRIVNGDRGYLGGKLELILCNKGMVDLLENDDTANLDDIQEVSPLSEFPLDGERISLISRIIPGKYFVWVEFPGFSVTPRFLTFPLKNGPALFKLSPIPPLVVKVVDEGGQALASIDVSIENRNLEPGYFSMGWEKRLELQFFWKDYKTSADGRVVLRAPLSGKMTVFARGRGYALNVTHEAEAGKECKLVLSRAFSIIGRIRSVDKKPLKSVDIEFFAIDKEGEPIGLAGTQTVDKEGKFEIPNVTVGYNVLLALATAKGQSPQFIFVRDPEPGQTKRVDFLLHPGLSVDIRMLSENGSPLPGIGAQVMKNDHFWVPSFYTSDSEGKIHTIANLEAGKGYLLFVTTGDTFLGMFPFRVPKGKDHHVDIHLPPLAKVRKVEVEGLDAAAGDMTVFLQSHALPGEKVWSWGGNEESPWIPAGPGLLVVKTKDGKRAREEIELAEGKTPVLNLKRRTGKIRFLLPEVAKGQPWKVSRKSLGGAVMDSWDLFGGEQTIESEVGEFYLAVSGADHPGTLFGPFPVKEGLLELGTLTPAASGSISGRILGPDGKPWPGMEVDLKGDAGLEADPAYADDEGNYSFSGLPAGDYLVRLSPFFSTYLQNPDRYRRVSLPSGEDKAGVDFVLDDRSLSRVQVIPPPETVWTGFSFFGGDLERMQVDGNGWFSISAAGESAFYGAYELDGSRFSLLSRPLGPAKEGLVLDRGQGMVEKRVRLVDAEGKKLARRRTEFLVEGYRLPGGAFSDEEGKLTLSLKGPLHAEMIVSNGSEGTSRVDVGRLPAEGDLVVGSGSFETVVTVVDLAGRPLPMTNVRGRALRTYTVTDRSGEASFTVDGGDPTLVVEKAGYWRVVARAQAQTRVALRKTVPQAAFKISEALFPEQLTLEPEFDLGYRLRVTSRMVEGKKTAWQATNLPEGAYTVTVENQKGEMVLEQEVQLLEGGQTDFVLE